MPAPRSRGGMPAATPLVPLLAAVLSSAAVTPALAQRRAAGEASGARTHVVAEGETLRAIADAYGVTVADLIAANRLADPDRVRVGQTLAIPRGASAVAPAVRGAAGEESPAGGEARGREARVTRRGVILYVAEGQTLSDIASTYGVPVARLLRANDLPDANAVRAGQRLLVPGATEVRRVRRVRREEPRSAPITFLRVANDETVTVRLFDRRGRVIAAERDKVTRLFRHLGTGRQRAVSVELLRLLQRVADHWPGRRILVYSGYRPYRRHQYTRHSKHNVGRAVDFRVDGVSNAELRDFCRTLPDAGVGYYPNSYFVHLDARERRAYWVDWSGPGERPRYGREGRDPAAPEETAAEVEEAEAAAGGEPLREAGVAAGGAGVRRPAGGESPAAESPRVEAAPGAP